MGETRVLVAWASKYGSTAQIAKEIEATIRGTGLEADVRPAGEVRDVTPYGTVLLGSAVYATRWRRDAVRFLRRFRKALAERQVWLFQSGPLDHSAEESNPALPKKVAGLAAAVGARGHITFGGKLGPGASGFIARKMVQGGKGGDFRNFDHVRAWAEGIARELGASAAAS